MTVQNGNPVIIHPTAPSKDMEIILRLDRQRRREEGWPASEGADDAREENAATEPSLEEAVRDTTPVMRGGRRGAAAPARLIDELEMMMTAQRKRKNISLPIRHRHASVDHVEDGGSSPFREANETLMLTELSLFVDQCGRPRVKQTQATRQRPAAKAQGPRKAPRNNVRSKRQAAG
ncbi:MAG: hypothetical protein Q9173_004877 [Seirophora scorigena]